MTQSAKMQIENERLLTMAGNLLNGYFIQANKDLGKKRFKEIDDGKSVQLGSLEGGDGKMQVDLKLSLDSSEFRGHLTFHLFAQALASMLKNYSNYLPDKKKAPFFTNEQAGSGIFLIPGVIENDGQVNMLALGVEAVSDNLNLKLQFIDPEQFRSEQE